MPLANGSVPSPLSMMVALHVGGTYHAIFKLDFDITLYSSSRHGIKHVKLVIDTIIYYG
jgi:hypothetical protein